MAFHTITNRNITERVTLDPAWDRGLTIPWKQFMTMHVGDGLEILGGDGDYIGSIEDIGDAESGENWIVVDLM